MLLTIFPVGPVPLVRRPIWSERIPEAVDRVNRELRAMAGPGLEVVDCDTILAEGGWMKEAYAADEFHLTRAAYEVPERDRPAEARPRALSPGGPE